MKIEILTIGNELLLGFTQDTNSVFLSRELTAMGVEVVRHCSVEDDASIIAAEIRSALDRTGAVITSGGLGPTSDDVTVAGVALAFQVEVAEDLSVVEGLRELFRSRGHSGELSPSNRRQALVPVGAQLLPNKRGTAPGIWFEDTEGRWLASLPGVPNEMRGLFRDEVAPRLKKLVHPGEVILTRTLRTTGIAEAAVAEIVRKSTANFRSLAYLPGWEGVDLRLTIKDLAEDLACVELENEAAELRQLLGTHYYGEANCDLAALVLELLRLRSYRVAVAESCTGGLLGVRLSDTPGASDVFLGGAIVYSNELKSSLLAVPYATLQQFGAVSEEAVIAMARGVCAATGAEVGIAISGVAGPGGGSAEKPVGTVWVAVNVAGNVSTLRRVLAGERAEVRARAAQMALDVTRAALMEQLPPQDT